MYLVFYLFESSKKHAPIAKLMVLLVIPMYLLSQLKCSYLESKKLWVGECNFLTSFQGAFCRTVRISSIPH